MLTLEICQTGIVQEELEYSTYIRLWVYFINLPHATGLESLTKWLSLIKVFGSEEDIQGIVFIIQIEEPEQNTGMPILQTTGQVFLTT